MGNIQDSHQVKTCNTQWLRQLFFFLTKPERMQELKWGGQRITGPNHHYLELGENQNGIKKVFFCFLVFFLCVYFMISFQATRSNIYQDKQISHTLGLSGINRSETAACSTCLEILVEFQEQWPVCISPSKLRSIYALCQWCESRSRLVLTTIEIPFSLQSVLRMNQAVLTEDGIEPQYQDKINKHKKVNRAVCPFV